MSVKKVSGAELDAWVDSLIAKQKVIGVQSKSDRFAFDELTKAADLRLDYDVTILPPKRFFQPACETMMTFSKEGYQSVMDNDEFVLLGVHPYDLEAIIQMDEIFEQDNDDMHYKSRRNAATIIAVDVQTPSVDVFAGVMGTSHLEDGFDVLLTKVDDGYVVEAKTDKGEALVSDLADAGDGDVESRSKVWEANKASLVKHELKAEPSTWPALLENADDHPVWAEKSEKCFSCGSCNLACPTCYCFDVSDDVNWDLETGERSRTWDSCMLPGFATVAGNHNFRDQKAARFRHRYYRKGAYVPSRIGGKIACVGCGRCITACVANIANPVEIFNSLQEG